MKNSKKAFILTEAVLGFLVALLAAVMLLDKNGEAPDKISVIVENSEDKQWAAFRYGLRMAAADLETELSIVPTEGELTLEEEMELIRQEIRNGADGVIIQPVPGPDTEEMLGEIGKKVPVMLVGSQAVRDGGEYPLTSPDNYRLGEALGEELIRDCRENLRGKTLGILSQNSQSPAILDRYEGFSSAVKGAGAQVRWNMDGNYGEEEGQSLEDLSKVDFVIALDDRSTAAAGASSSANDLHGAIVYGVGSSTDAAYYLDTGKVQCLVVPDGFSEGYQSLEELSRKLEHSFGKMEDRLAGYTVIRRDTLFTEENQEILFTMSQ